MQADCLYSRLLTFPQERPRAPERGISCLEHQIKVGQWIEDIDSALNYKRKGFNEVVEQVELGLFRRLLIVSQDRFVRFGLDWF